MSSEHDSSTSQSDGKLDPSPEEGFPFLVSKNPSSTCPECDAGEEYKEAIEVDYGVPEGREGEEGVFIVIAVECDSCGLFDKSVVE